MGRKPDLPCDIEQVVDLLGIEVIRDTGTQLIVGVHSVQIEKLI